MNWVEIIAVLFSVASVILMIVEHRLCWPIGIIGIVFYGILFYQNEIWGNMALQVAFIAQSIIGMVSWKKNKNVVSWLDEEQIFMLAFIATFVTVIVSDILFYCGGEYPFMDSITMILSLCAMFLMALKKADGWILWMVTDLVFVVFFAISGLNLSSLTYLLFFVLASIGFLRWKRNIKEG